MQVSILCFYLMFLDIGKALPCLCVISEFFFCCFLWWTALLCYFHLLMIFELWSCTVGSVDGTNESLYTWLQVMSEVVYLLYWSFHCTDICIGMSHDFLINGLSKNVSIFVTFDNGPNVYHRFLPWSKSGK